MSSVVSLLLHYLLIFEFCGRANSALAGLTKAYKNAFSIVSPIILDSRVLTLSDDSYYKSVRHMIKWGITARGELLPKQWPMPLYLHSPLELCEYIGEGIRKVRIGQPPWQYIPALDWRAVQDNMGPSLLYDHLVSERSSNEDQEGCAAGKDARTLLETVCRVLDLEASEVSVDVPLTAYGVDSLSAAALSFALRPFLAVSQVQLLADVTIRMLQEKIENDQVVSES